MSKSIRIHQYLYDEIERLARAERRSLVTQLEILLEQALQLPENQPRTHSGTGELMTAIEVPADGSVHELVAEATEEPGYGERAAEREEPSSEERAVTADEPVSAARAAQRKEPDDDERALAREKTVTTERAAAKEKPDGMERAAELEKPEERKRVGGTEKPADAERPFKPDFKKGKKK